MSAKFVLECSVLASVYAKEKPSYFRTCLQSLVNQNRRFNELVLVEDGPLPYELKAVIEEFKELLPLRIIKIPENRGLGNALNEGLNACENELVVRVDTDDYNLPNRLERLVEFMNSNPDIDVCGSYIEERCEELDYKLSVRMLPLDSDRLYRFGRFRCPVSHPSVIFRKSSVQKVGGYPNLYPEDHALWGLMLFKGFKFANIPEVLVYMRAGSSMISRRGLNFLKGEITVFRYFRQLGYIGCLTFLFNVTVRSILRLSPNFLKSFFYRRLRTTQPNI